MKRVFIALCLGSVAFVACKEKAPPINLTAGNLVALDTTYVVSPVPTADAHNVLVEDFTGASCSNCPTAHTLLETIVGAHPAGTINVIGLYVTDFSQTIPPNGAAYDFRDSVATLIEQNIYGPLYGMPIGGIDRMPFGSVTSNGLQTLSSGWNSAVTSQLAITDSINLKVTSVYDSTSRDAAVTATITYLVPTTTMHNLSIALVEDGFTDLQEDGSVIDSAYAFNDIFRDLITSAPFGDPILPAMTAKEAGRVALRTYVYHVKTGINPAHCRVIAFVHDNAITYGHVRQSVQAKLAP